MPSISTASSLELENSDTDYSSSILDSLGGSNEGGSANGALAGGRIPQGSAGEGRAERSKMQPEGETVRRGTSSGQATTLLRVLGRCVPR